MDCGCIPFALVVADISSSASASDESREAGLSSWRESFFMSLDTCSMRRSTGDPCSSSSARRLPLRKLAAIAMASTRFIIAKAK